jgi:hypothetical protein
MMLIGNARVEALGVASGIILKKTFVHPKMAAGPLPTLTAFLFREPAYHPWWPRPSPTARIFSQGPISFLKAAISTDRRIRQSLE